MLLHSERVEIRHQKEGGVCFPDEVGHYWFIEAHEQSCPELCRLKSLVSGRILCSLSSVAAFGDWHILRMIFVS